MKTERETGLAGNTIRCAVHLSRLSKCLWKRLECLVFGSSTHCALSVLYRTDLAGQRQKVYGKTQAESQAEGMEKHRQNHTHADGGENSLHFGFTQNEIKETVGMKRST